MTWQKRDDRRPDARRERAEQEPLPALAAWLAAEEADDDAGAEAALGSLFAALPPVDPPPGLTERVLAATVWSVEPTPTEVARGWWRAAAVLAGLALATLFAGGALAPSLVALVDPAAAVAGTLESLWVIARAAGGWLGVAASVADVLPRLGAAALLVASSPEAVAALVVGAALTALAIRVLHQVIERDRRLSYAEAG